MALVTIPHGSTQHRAYRYFGWAFFVLVVVLVAFAYVDVGQLSIGDNNYNLSVTRINKAIAFMIAILGLQIIVGYTGQVALGQSFFVGLGAYITAYLVEDQGWRYLTTLAVVLPVCFIVGMLLGLPALRIKGLYLALVTISVAAIFPAVVRLDQLFDYTNGSNGKLVSAPIEAPEWLPFDAVANALQALPVIGGTFGDGDLSSREIERLWKYLLFAIVAGVCFWMISNLVNSRHGRALRTLRDSEASAAVSGIDVPRTKTLGFGIGSALGGVGGTVYVMELGIASPDDFSLLLAINLLVGLVVGGVANPWGAVLGGLVITMIPDWSSSTQSVGFLPDRALQGPTGTLILGLLLILLTFVLPGGIVAGISSLWRRVVRVVPVAPDMAALAAAAGAGATVSGAVEAADDAAAAVADTAADAADDVADVAEDAAADAADDEDTVSS